MVGRLVSFWDGLFSGATLVLGRLVLGSVVFDTLWKIEIDFTFMSGFSYKIYPHYLKGIPTSCFFEIIESWIKVNNHHGRMIQKVQTVTKTANPNISICKMYETQYP